MEEAGRRLVVRHDAIPGLMPEMTMPFEVRGTTRTAFPGDSITARLVVTRSDSWLEGVRVARAATAVPAAPVGEYAPRQVGERLSDFRLTDQEGHIVQLRDLRGKTAVVTFIYTRCPLPNYCPLMSQRFTALQEAVRRDRRLRDRVTLLTVSFDPKYDTPARLRAYGRQFNADPRVWRLVTGEDAQVKRLAGELGVIYAPDRGLINHNLETAVLDSAGRLARRLSGNEWTADSLIKAVRQAVLVGDNGAGPSRQGAGA